MALTSRILTQLASFTIFPNGKSETPESLVAKISIAIEKISRFMERFPFQLCLEIWEMHNRVFVVERPASVQKMHQSAAVCGNISLASF
mgnify:CR=1 FL=1